MKADHWRLELRERVGEVRAERRATHRRSRAVERDPELGKIRGQYRPPPLLALRIELGLSMAKEVDVEWFGRVCLDSRELSTHLVDADHRAGQGSESTGIGNRDRQRASLHASHRRLNDRDVDAENLAQVHHVLGGYSECVSSQWKRWSTKWKTGERTRAVTTRKTKPAYSANTPAKIFPERVATSPMGPMPPRSIAAFSNASTHGSPAIQW